MPETGWMTGEPPEPEPPPDWRRVEILADALTKLPPRDFAVFFEMAGGGYEPELRAAVSIAVNIVNVHLAAYPPGSPQYMDAAARADELHRLTMGDDHRRRLAGKRPGQGPRWLTRGGRAALASAPLVPAAALTRRFPARRRAPGTH